MEGGLRLEIPSEKEKGLVDMDNSVVTAGETGVSGSARGYNRDKW